MLINLAIALLGLAMYILHGVQTGELQSPWAVAPDTLSFWYGVLNMVLRYLATQPIAGSKP
jgi:hypothetical protein